MKNKIKENSFSIIGGDLRIVNVAKILSKSNKVFTYGLENANIQLENVEECNSLTQAIGKGNTIITAIPISKNKINVIAEYSNKKILIQEFINDKCLKDKLIITGRLGENNEEVINKNRVIDILENEEFAILNAISTAEGALALAINETPITISGSNVLVMGFGRIGKILVNRLKSLNANVYCTARKKTDFAWITAYGAKEVEYSNFDSNLKEIDIVFNTVPAPIFTEKQIKTLKKTCVIIDLASFPGEINQRACKENNIKCFLYLGVPGKVAPLTSANIIVKIIENYNNIKDVK